MARSKRKKPGIGMTAAMTKKYETEAKAAIHETMEALYEIGAIDKQTMREFDESCLSEKDGKQWFDPARHPELMRK